VTYPAEDSERLAAAVDDVLSRRAEIVANMEQLDVIDTLDDEVALLTNTTRGSRMTESRRAPQWQ
jgi:hypothetical protein